MAEQVFDIAVIGGGPAGLSAALTGRIRNKQVALFEHLNHSQKLQKAHLVNNYPGLPEISGKDLIGQMYEHCMKLEPKVIKEKVLSVFPGEVFTILTSGATYEARSVVLATGVVSTVLFPGERDYLGRGVSYCATCDGMLFRDKRVAVVSYTVEGAHEAKFLGEICREVFFLPQYKVEELPQLRDTVKVITDRPVEIRGGNMVEALVTTNGELSVDGVFILRQSDPVENLLPGVELEGEVIKVGRDMTTSIPGVFAAGDCTGKPWQIAKATGEGLVAVLSAIGYLEAKTRQA